MPNQQKKYPKIQQKSKGNELVNSIREKRGPALDFIAQTNHIQSFTHSMSPSKANHQNQEMGGMGLKDLNYLTS
ncbi:Os09g0440851 [Oryza sativa Japonica Group]|uniref:Os09g0440851 protein n=1 Tax=Oryza sativa subsp. japonica TaxID=39947 RepID=A0A0P0XM91_ORYSJ|nr:hypothetical protein EE612_048114 [Oryza sativa]BAT08292.1 Os09g0440851 [Oryza sativa Japonica Group]